MLGTKYLIIYTICIVLPMTAEQICIILFCQYPFVFGIPIKCISLTIPNVVATKNINDQLIYIGGSLSNDNYKCKLIYDSNKIYIRSKYNNFMQHSGVWAMFGTIYFRDGWRVSIRVGIFMSIMIIGLCLIAIIFTNIVVALLIMSFLIGGRVAEYRKLYKHLAYGAAQRGRTE